MFQLPKKRISLEYVHDHPHVPRESRRMGSTRAIIHRHFQHPGIFFCYGHPSPFPTSANASDSPCKEKHGALSNGMYSPWSSGEYISPESLCLLESISGAQQLAIIVRKYNLQAPRLLTQHAVDDSMQYEVVNE